MFLMIKVHYNIHCDLLRTYFILISHKYALKCINTHNLYINFIYLHSNMQFNALWKQIK